MKKYEYHFWYENNKFAPTKEIQERTIEAEWNRLGAEGWRYCSTGWSCVIFMRAIQDEC